MTTVLRKMTVAEYLERERHAERKHEYLDGEARMMPDVTPRHSVLTVSIGAALKTRLRGKKCTPMSSVVRVHVTETGLFAYPDVTVICGGVEYHPDEPNAVTNPRVIFEVLSRGTTNWDSGIKCHHYLQISSLAECVLVSQNERRLMHYLRRAPREWLISFLGPDDVLKLPSLDCEIPLAEIYEGAFDVHGDAWAWPTPAD